MSEYQTTQKKKYGFGIKIVLTLSLLLNMVCIGFLGFVYFTYKPYINLFLKNSSTQVFEDQKSTTTEKESEKVQIEQLPDDVQKILEEASVKVPTTITPELETCLRTAVGEDRARAIQAGASPTPTELIQAMNCLK